MRKILLVMVSNPEIKQEKITRADKVRQGLVFLFTVLVVPGITYIAYGKIVGVDYFYSENGQLIAMGLSVFAMMVVYIAYKTLFSKYSDDLPEPFF